ncbi:nucleotidyltransferase domain-containing protein [Limnoglobus roseus]|uniref:Nucleotidyltransferase domain-containing protein n=1 Tax=Limnoglobus roseus TaxID=2598579 RepID=A0A5C1A7P1_9BACT|nr:nucleotidyltransferase domain-containing protein [Limnoglobus roseus]QEL13862.1 hypothetical protein PX52LOC_00720 [Limnoglobus roseus]
MDSTNLFNVASGLLAKNPPPMAVEAWGFGGYAENPDSASDVDILLIFRDGALHKREEIWEHCAALKVTFESLTGKELDISRLTAKEAADTGFIAITNAIHIWSHS